MAYQLWELDSRNCVAEFASLEDALAAVRDMVSARGEAAVASLLLVEENAEGDLKKIAGGATLARLAASSPASGQLIGHPAPR